MLVIGENANYLGFPIADSLGRQQRVPIGVTYLIGRSPLCEARLIATLRINPVF
jgi:hypothetical protein